MCHSVHQDQLSVSLWQAREAGKCKLLHANATQDQRECLMANELIDLVDSVSAVEDNCFTVADSEAAQVVLPFVFGALTRHPGELMENGVVYEQARGALLLELQAEAYRS